MAESSLNVIIGTLKVVQNTVLKQLKLNEALQKVTNSTPVMESTVISRL